MPQHAPDTQVAQNYFSQLDLISLKDNSGQVSSDSAVPRLTQVLLSAVPD